MRLVGMRPTAPHGTPSLATDPYAALAAPFRHRAAQALGLVVAAALMFTLAWASIAARLADQAADPWNGDVPDGLALGDPSATASDLPADVWFPGSPGWDQAFEGSGFDDADAAASP